MGIGTAIKSMMRDEAANTDSNIASGGRNATSSEYDRGLANTSDQAPARRANTTTRMNKSASESRYPTGSEYDRGRVNTSSDTSPRRAATTSGMHKLPPGTGPGTSGIPASEADMQSSGGYTRGGNLMGHGTDSAAARGAGAHGDPKQRFRSGDASRSSGAAGAAGAAVLANGPGASSGTERAGAQNVTRARADSSSSSSSAHSGYLQGTHHHGHNRRNAGHVMPSGATQEDTNQLNPVTHERVRHVETEEVQRVLEHDRHIHHVQHHIQPIIASETLAEKIRDFVHPVTSVHEVHANKAEDNSFFDGQLRQHRDSVIHVEKERAVIDKGVTIKENTHHHVHHVIQPVIEKEIIDRERIRTTIPIREVTHEAPVVHQSQTHSAVPIEHFLQRGGTLSGALSHEEIGPRVLHRGKCTREVDGIADTLARELRLAGTFDPTTSSWKRMEDTDTTDTGGVRQKPQRATSGEGADVPITASTA